MDERARAHVHGTSMCQRVQRHVGHVQIYTKWLMVVEYSACLENPEPSAKECYRDSTLYKMLEG